MPRFADTTIGAPSVSSIRSKSDHLSDVVRARHPLRGGADGCTRDVFPVSSSNKSDVLRGPPLSSRCENDSGAAAVEIGREARELASRMHVDLAQLRSSVDLQTQTDRALVMNADRHFHIAARMWYTMLQASDRRIPSQHSREGASEPRIDTIVPSFHFVPMSTGPQLTLNILESRAVSLSHQHRSEQRHQQKLRSSSASHRTGHYRHWHDSDGAGVVEEDVMNLMDRYRPADAWMEEEAQHAGQHGVHRPKPRSTSADKPRWNVSSQPDPETVVDPYPLSVEEPTKDWLARKQVARKRSASAEKAAMTGNNGPNTQRRQLRFEGPDGSVSVGGPRHMHGGGVQQRSKEPVRCGAGNESVERIFGPHAYGRSMTGLWSQVSGERVREAAMPRATPTFGHNNAASSHPRDAAAAQESKAYYPTLGDAGAKALGFVHDNSQANVSMGDDEIFARRHLHSMNINVAPSRPGALDHPVWSGAVLCRVVNMIVRQFLPRQQLKEVPVHEPSGLSFDDVKANFVNALTRIRELHVPTGMDPIAPRLLYLDPKEILSGLSCCDMWSLLAKLIEVFILKTDRKAQGSSISGNANASGPPAQLPMLGRYCEAYSARNMARLEESVCHFLYSMNVSVEPVLHAIPADHEASQSLIPGPLNAPFLPDKRSRWHLRTTPLSTVSLPSVFPYLTNGSMLCDVVSYVLDTDISTFRNPRVRVGCIANIRNAQDELLKHYPSKISNMFLCDPTPVYEGDKAFILLLLEDVMRLAANAPPRKHLPGVDQVPFLLPERWSAGAATASDMSSPQAAMAVKPHHDATMTANEISAGMASASHAAQFVQPERQAFVSDPAHHTQLKWTLADLAIGHREGSAGSQGSQPSVAAPFTSSKANPAPKTIQLRAIGVTTTAPSSGRSIVPSDEVPEELHDEPPEPPALLPRHLEYLMAMHVEERELVYLGDWLVSKLGRAYRYVAADASFEITARDIKLSHPSLIFSDGVVLSHLVRILSYHKCPQLDNIQTQPKTTAAKRNNIKKVLEYLRTERKTLVDYVFLEDVLVTGDLRAVVLVLRALRSAYKNHISSVR